MHLTGIFRACCQQSKQNYNVTQQTPKLHLEIYIENSLYCFLRPYVYNESCLHKTEYLQWNTCLRLAVAVQGIIKEEIIKSYPWSHFSLHDGTRDFACSTKFMKQTTYFSL